MIFENVLDEYKAKVEKRAPKRKLSQLESTMHFLLILVAIALSVGTVCLSHTHDLKDERNLAFICIALTFIAIGVSEYRFRRDWENRKELYYKRLEKLMEMLRENHWNSEEKIAFLIERCDEYMKTDSEWVKQMKPFKKMLSVFVIPALVFIFNEMYSDYEEKKIEILVTVFLFSFLVGMLVCVVIPMLYDEFNRRGKLAEKMMHDLKQLQLEQKLKA